MKWHQHLIVMQVLSEAESECARYRIDAQRIRGLTSGEIVQGSNQNLWVVDINEILDEMISLGDVEKTVREGGTFYRLTASGRMSAMDMQFTELPKGPLRPPVWPKISDVLLGTKAEREEALAAQ